MASAGSIFVDLLLKDQNYVQGLNRARQNTRGFAGQAQGDLAKTRQAFAGVINPVSNLSAAVRNLGIAVASYLSVQKLVQYTDTYKQLEGRLSIVVSESINLKDVQQELFDIAQRTRQPLEGIYNLYTRLAQAIPEAQRSQFDLLGVTENINKALAITGEGSAQAASAILQFTQAAASGFKGSGQEINALLDSAPRLAIALQQSFGDGSKSLKELSKDGDLTTESVLRALSSISGQAQLLAEEFEKTEVTVGQAFTKLENSFLNFIGTSDSARTSSASLANAITGLSIVFDNLDGYITKASFALDKFNSKGGSGSVITPDMFDAALPPGYTEYSDGEIQAGIDRAIAIEEQRERDKSSKAEKLAKEREKQAASDAKKRADELASAYEQNRKYILGLDSATVQYMDTQEELNELLQAGKLSQEEYTFAMKNLTKEFEENKENVNEWGIDVESFGKKAAENIQDSFADFLFDPFDQGLDGMLKGFVDTVRRMIAEAQAAQLAKYLFGETAGGEGGGFLGGILGSLGGLFGGSTFESSALRGATTAKPKMFADGGFLGPGQFGIAGEAGAELLYGGRTGVSVFNQDQMGGRGNTYQFNVGTQVNQDDILRLQQMVLATAGPGVIEQRVSQAQMRGAL